uniref:Uncharacterized protein n=1 Tax=Anguilla anguilla TaxID=7936 RepID=A0A0E9TUQ4_ANGAN
MVFSLGKQLGFVIFAFYNNNNNNNNNTIPFHSLEFEIGKSKKVFCVLNLL